jgi:hypothetical protein
MRIVAALLLGLLIGCVLVAGLVVFKNAAWAKAEQWSQQTPPPRLTLAHRIFLSAGAFVGRYWLVSAPLVVLASVGLAALVAVPQSRTPPPASRNGRRE